LLPDAAVPLPTCASDGDRGRLAGEIRQWASSPPMRGLVAAFGGALPDTGTGKLLAWLDEYSGIHWDFRTGRLERYEVAKVDFSEPLENLVREVAAALGLVGARRPPARRYRHLLILGGLARTCLQRTEYAARLVDSGTVTVPEVAALSSFRPLRPDEGLVPQLAGCGYEVEAMEVGVRASFRATTMSGQSRSPGDITHESWAVRVFEPDNGPRVQVFAAPSSEPATRRADTSDTYHFWAAEARPRPGERILVVTSPIYVPFQHADAVRLLGLPYRVGVDTVGFDPTVATTPQPAQAGDTHRYLQEIRSAIRSLRRLHDTLTGTAAPAEPEVRRPPTPGTAESSP
jgi:hypothetical protein